MVKTTEMGWAVRDWIYWCKFSSLLTSSWGLISKGFTSKTPLKASCFILIWPVVWSFRKCMLIKLLLIFVCLDYRADEHLILKVPTELLKVTNREPTAEQTMSLSSRAVIALTNIILSINLVLRKLYQCFWDKDDH